MSASGTTNRGYPWFNTLDEWTDWPSGGRIWRDMPNSECYWFRWNGHLLYTSHTQDVDGVFRAINVRGDVCKGIPMPADAMEEAMLVTLSIPDMSNAGDGTPRRTFDQWPVGNHMRQTVQEAYAKLKKIHYSRTMPWPCPLPPPQELRTRLLPIADYQRYQQDMDLWLEKYADGIARICQRMKALERRKDNRAWNPKGDLLTSDEFITVSRVWYEATPMPDDLRGAGPAPARRQTESASTGASWPRTQANFNGRVLW